MNESSNRGALLRACGLPESAADEALAVAAQILESVTDAFVFLDLDWRYRYVNARAGALFGRDPGDLIGKHIWTEFPEGVGQPFQLAYERAMREQTPIQLEAFYEPWGRWFENRIHPSKDGLSIFFQDVTVRHAEDDARRRAEEKLRQEARARAQAERMAHLGFWEWDVVANRIEWSEELFRIYGQDPATFGASYEAYLAGVHPEDRERVRAVISQALAGLDAFDFEDRVVRPDGTVRQLRSWGCVNRDDLGKPVSLVGTCLDVTELVETNEERRKFALLVENATDFIALVSIDGQILFLNDAGRQMVGLDSLEEANGKRVGEFLTAEGLRQSLEVELPSVLQTGRWEGEGQLVHFKTGKHIDVLTASFLVRDPASGSALCLATVRKDITLRRGLEEQLRQSQKLEAMGRLAAGVAHDFNNLLTIIGGMTGLVARDDSLSEEARGRVVEIDTAVQRATMLTRQLLSLSRPRAFQAVVLDLNAVVSEVSNLLSRLLPPETELRVMPAPMALPVRADRGHLEQVLLNLVVNARDAMPKGGRIVLSTFERDGRVGLSVSDTGTGMTPEVRERVFEPFFTTKEDGRGTGLGLSTVQGIVLQNGGTIEIESEPGSGSTFTVILSRSDEPITPEAPARPWKRGVAKETVLVVEDDGAVRRAMRAILEADGYRVLDTGSAENALRLCRSHGGTIDLLVTDVHMPKMGGRVLARQIREHWPALGVLYVSGMLDDGEGPLIEKPFTADTLSRGVRESLDSELRTTL